MYTSRATRFSLALGLALCLASTAACSQRGSDQESASDQDVATSQVTLTAAHAEKTASVAPDKILTVKLLSKPATGYVWEVEQVDTSVLKPLDEAHEFADERSGSAATHVHRFSPAGRGLTRLKLVYHRPWEKDVPPVQTYSVDVDVQGAYTGPAPAPLVAPTAQAQQELTEATVTATDLPAHYSVCETPGCTPIKDQGQCGSCWAFATVGVVEQLIKMKDNQTRDLSEQYLVSCNTEGWGCDGGYVAFDLFINSIPSGEPAAGAVHETDFPYKASDLACNPPHQHNEKLLSYTSVGSTAVAKIKSALLAHGPIWTAVCADASFSSYTGGVFADSGCKSLNHGVVIVGWDDNDGQGYWIMRNSWGSRWGVKGYMNIKWGANAIGSRDNYYATYAGSGSCTPTTCAAEGKDCGSIADGCGGTLSCGTCSTGETCSDNVCTTPACTPTTCAAEGKDCGSIADGCGGTLSCGTCPTGQTCSDNVCTTPACTPTTCAAQGKNCGSIADGCGKTLSCGTCTAPQTCGGAGVANVCGGGAGQACWTPYARSSCTSYQTGAQVSAKGHNWTCANFACMACAWYSNCAPGATGCRWGAVWTDSGACQ
jgi:inhibitor of cysteine peptidase